MTTRASHRSGQNSGVTFNAWFAGEVKSLMTRARSPGTPEKIVEMLKGKLPKELSSHKHEISHFILLREFKKFFGEHMNVIRDAVAARVPVDKLYKLLQKRSGKHELGPQWMLAEILREMHGRTIAPQEKLKTALSGINRLPFTDAVDRELISTSHSNPYHALPDVQSDRLKIAVISGPQFGLPYDPDIYRNLVRCGFSAARKFNSDCIVIGGRLLHIELKKRSGPGRLVDDVLSGTTAINFETFAEDYQDEVRQIEETASMDPIFRTAEERISHCLKGVFKVTHRPSNSGHGTVSEFKKPVYVILNPDDLKIAQAATHFHLLYKQMQRWLEANAEARAKAKEVAMHLKLQQQGHNVERELKAAREAAAKAAAKATRFRMSNLDATQNKKVLKRVLSYIIEKIEKAFPEGTQVIALNGAHMRFGMSKWTLEFISSDKPVHVKKLKTYGPKQRKHKLPDLTVSMHPGVVYPCKGSRENYVTKGKMLGTAGFFEAPILVDKEPILKAMEGWGPKLPVAEAVRDDMFVGGMSIITLNPHFMPNADVLRTEAVRYHGQPQVSRAPAKYAWFMLATDPHLSAANRLWLRNDLGSPIGITEGGFELMSRSGMGRNGHAYVCGITFADDLTQGNHFGTHLRPHHNQRTNEEVRQETEEKRRNSKDLPLEERYAILEGLSHELEDQLVMFRPSHHWGSQLKEFWHAILDKYEHVFKGTLMRARETGVVVKGVSQYNGFPIDARDVGLINFGSGNHATKTLQQAAFEGELVSDRLWVALRRDSDLKGINVKAAIRGPMFQDQSIGFGTMQIGDKGPTWGLHIAGTPPKRDSWYQLLHGWIQVNRQRGNISTILDNMPIIHMTGDKHFFGEAEAGDDLYVMGPSATHTDAFADIAGGLPENNPGLAFIGVPVDGPDRAGMIVKHLTPITMQNYLSSGEKFPWEDFLPNRA